MATTIPQRVVRAACPGCGAPVEFRSASSTHAVCSFCQSTVVREGEVLARIGKAGELFDDHSPLQLLTTGRFNHKAFTLVGRLQYRSPGGAWTEWNALFDDGGTGWLAEDNGAYMFAFPAAVQRELPQPAQLRVGATTAIDGKSFQVAFSDQVALVSAQGELPKLPPLDTPFAMVELRASDGEVLAIDYGEQPPTVSRGHAVVLDGLALAHLRDENVREAKGRQLACPNCGAQVQVHLGSSKSITCAACRSIIDLRAGLGGELHHAAQADALVPLIPLGATGPLQGVHWQVVGYMHRIGRDPQDDEDEHFGWDEYLLYNRKRGFVFLVDSTEGWSLVKPVTGAPQYTPGASTASYLGTRYEQESSYRAETTYVAGEFYWPVERGQVTFNRDFAKGKALLSLEETPRERTWSSGSRIDSDSVAKAFGLEAKKDLLARTDAGPTTPSSAGIGCSTLIILFIVVILLTGLLRACDGDGTSGSGYRTSGGSRGGYSSGGSHK